MISAFQKSAFQNNAYQIAAGAVTKPVAGWFDQWDRIPRKRWFEELQEEYAEAYRLDHPEPVAPTKAKKAKAKVREAEQEAQDVLAELQAQHIAAFEPTIRAIAKTLQSAKMAERAVHAIVLGEQAIKIAKKLRQELEDEEEDITLLLMSI